MCITNNGVMLDMSSTNHHILQRLVYFHGTGCNSMPLNGTETHAYYTTAQVDYHIYILSFERLDMSNMVRIFGPTPRQPDIMKVDTYTQLWLIYSVLSL